MAIRAADTTADREPILNKDHCVEHVEHWPRVRGGSPIADAAAPVGVRPRTSGDDVPAYLREHYSWAYLNARNARLLDRESVVAAILWGRHGRLRQMAFEEVSPGDRVLQPACVYGDFSPRLAAHIGPRGSLEVTDAAAIQVARCEHKLRGFPWASVRRTDAACLAGGDYDAVCCYFLLHEVPQDYKRRLADALLDNLAPGGKAVFIDYHKPHPAHPLRPIMSLVFATLEPFARDLWNHGIADFASHPEHYRWRKETCFGGLFQKVVAERA